MNRMTDDEPQSATFTPGKRMRLARKNRPPLIRKIGFILVAAAAGFLGALGAMQLDLLRTSQDSITNNRQTVVSQEGEVIAEAAKKISPSVVSVTTQTSGRDFFGRPQESEGAGTGVIVSKDGYVLTNKHVIPEGTTQVSVVTSDGKTYEQVKVVGADPSNDIAFLKIEGVNNLPVATLGDSDAMTVGQKVIAVGNALGQFQNTVTQGIISSKGRPLTASDTNGDEAESLSNLFQTDAAINPGNSGGPLVNINGEVIGINTAVAQEAEGIGFAIPINDVKGLLSGVLEKGRIIKAYLGVQYLMLTPDTANQLNAELDDGALVYAGEGEPVVPGSPAEKAGLRRGDIITKVGGKAVDKTTSLASRLSQYKPGDEVELTIHRDGQDSIVKVILEEYK